MCEWLFAFILIMPSVEAETNEPMVLPIMQSVDSFETEEKAETAALALMQHFTPLPPLYIKGSAMTYKVYPDPSCRKGAPKGWI